MHRTFMFYVSMVIVCLFTFSGKASSAQPNVILIVCDDLNDYVEGFGGHHKRRHRTYGVLPQREFHSCKRTAISQSVVPHGQVCLREFIRTTPGMALLSGTATRYSKIHERSWIISVRMDTKPLELASWCITWFVRSGSSMEIWLTMGRLYIRWSE